MAMSERQIQKEILRIKKEIDLTESQLQSGQKSKADKEQENIRIEEDIKTQEADNERLATELQKHESNILELDEEFKDNQLKAGRVRKEMNMIKEDVEKKKKEEKELRAELERLVNLIEDTKRKVKEEKHSKETSEYNLRKTNAKLAEIQTHWAAKYIVTPKIEREAKKAGRSADEIIRSKEHIEVYESAAVESQLAQSGKSEKSSAKDDTDSKIEIEAMDRTSNSKEKKDEEKGLDLTF